MKNPLTAGIEPATFRLVAQHLNHCATLPRSPQYSTVQYNISMKLKSLCLLILNLLNLC